MSTDKEFFAEMDNEMLVRMVMDGFRRTIVHYGAWFAEVAHQVGLDKAMAVEDAVWQASVGNSPNHVPLVRWRHPSQVNFVQDERSQAT